MAEIVLKKTDAARQLRPSDPMPADRRRFTLAVLTVFIYMVQILMAAKLLVNGRHRYDTFLLVSASSQGLGEIFNTTALAQFDRSNNFETADFGFLAFGAQRYSAADMSDLIMMRELSLAAREKALYSCHDFLRSTHASAHTECTYGVDVCDTQAGVRPAPTRAKCRRFVHSSCYRN